MSRRRVAALLLATLALAGCGEKSEPSLSGPAAVTGTVELERAAPAVPDAGTTAGHKAAASATTRRARFSFGGRVEPPSARVELTPTKSTTVQTRADGRFLAQLRKLSRGRHHYVLHGTSPGLRPWTVAISITRK
jgi:hypothetical protein